MAKNDIELTIEDQQSLVAMLDRGVPVAEVRRRFGGLTPMQVTRIAQQVRTPPSKKADKAARGVAIDKKLVEIKAMVKYQQGYSASRIAALAGTSPAYVKRWLDNKRATTI